MSETILDEKRKIFKKVRNWIIEREAKEPVQFIKKKFHKQEVTFYMKALMLCLHYWHNIISK